MNQKKKILLTIIGVLMLGFSSFMITKYYSTRPESKPDTIQSDGLSQDSLKKVVLTVLSENVKLRQEPNSKSQEVAVLNLGSKVELISKSVTTTQIGEFQDYWYNVKADGKTGWIFGEFLSENERLKEKVPKRFEQTLKSLSTKDSNSVSNALRTYKALAPLVNDSIIDDNMFRSFRTFYISVMDNLILNEKEQQALREFFNFNNNSLNIDKINNNEIKAKVYSLKQNGFIIASSEGGLYITEDPDFLLSGLSEFVSTGVSEFLAIRKKEMKEGFSEDASLIVSWNTLSDRIVTWEKYLKKFPSHNEAKEAKDYIDSYLKVYIVGMDNSPTFSYDTKKLEPELARSYERFIKQYPNSEYHPIIKIYYDTLKKNDFAYTKEAKDFLKSQGIDAARLDYMIQ